ncbi:hypothetical protein V6N13_139077 [Hibiscus sabdariffa]
MDGDNDKAMMLLEVMSTSNVEHTKFEALGHFNKMNGGGSEPDVITYTILLNGYMKGNSRSLSSNGQFNFVE